MANDYMAKLAADLDGMTMGGLASKGRYGDTMIAHINPQEAQMLMDKGGAGTINPMTGLPEFYFDDPGYTGGDAADVSDAAGGGDLDFAYDLEQAADIKAAEQAAEEAAYTDAQTPEEQQYNLPPGTLDLVTGVGRGGPEEFEGDFFNFKDSLQEMKDRFEKGNVTKAQDQLLSEILARGYVGKEARDLAAELLANPGVRAAVEKSSTSGLKYSSLVEDALAARTNTIATLTAQLQAARQRQDEEAEQDKQDYFDDYGAMGGTIFEEDRGMFDKFLGGVKDFITGPSERNELEMDMAAREAGFTFDPRSTMDKGIDFALSRMPGLGPIKGVSDLLAYLTDSRIMGTVNTPFGPFQVTESGKLLGPDIPEEISDPGGNMPEITKKRKVVTEKPKEEEEKEEEENKPYFPEISTATLTPSEIQTITNIYGPDSYLLNQNQTGLRTLV